MKIENFIDTTQPENIFPDSFQFLLQVFLALAN